MDTIRKIYYGDYDPVEDEWHGGQAVMLTGIKELTTRHAFYEIRPLYCYRWWTEVKRVMLSGEIRRPLVSLQTHVEQTLWRR